MTELNTGYSPLLGLDYRFETYLNRRKAQLSGHMLGNGVPDYAYKMDGEYRKKLDSIPKVYDTAKKICTTIVSREMQTANLSYLAVGPEQFPEIYKIACDCAKKLGIAIPNIYIRQESVLNACAYASDDVEPFIVITEFALERLSLGELQALIGHECGHVQNYHSTYSVLTQLLTTIGVQSTSMVNRLLTAILSTGVQLTLKMWSRAAEVTADRAAMICCDNIEDAYNLNKKLLYGGVKVEDKITTELDIESLQKQLNVSYDSTVRYLELNATHPATIKRILAEMEFAECEIFYQWRPDLKKHNRIIRTREETDSRCKKFIDVTSKDAGMIVGKRRSEKRSASDKADA